MARLLIALFSFGSLLFGAAPARADSFPQTSALQSDLTAQQTSLENLDARLERTGKQVDDARTKVSASIAMVKAVASADDKLASVIKELKTLSNVPQLKMLPPAVKLLENVRKQVHATRVKGDRFHADVLKPLDIRLKSLKSEIQVSRVQLKLSAVKARLAHTGLAESRKLIERRGSPAAEVAALEALAVSVRVDVKPTTDGIAALDHTAGDLERQLNRLSASLKAFIALKPGVDELLKGLKPFSDVASELKKVMAQKISVKVLTTQYGFTVRQVLEGPKNVSDIVLKPLQELADKAIADVLKAFKLKLDAPPEFAALQKKMEAVLNSVAEFPQAFDLDVEFLKGYDQSLTRVTKDKTG